MTSRAKPSSCQSCPCASHGTDFSSIEGTGANGVMLVGEASGEHEQRDQLPFRPYAPAGGVLERTFRRMGVDRQSFSITNVLRCRPRNNWLEGAPWEFSAINHCRPNLGSAIADRRPRAIVALGGTAVRRLTGLAGEALGVSHLAGYVLPLEDAQLGQIPVIPNFHPAFLRRGKASHQGVFARILQRAIHVAAGRDREWMWGVDPEDRSTHGPLNYLTRTSDFDVRDYIARLRSRPDAVVSYDLETAESTSLDEDAREGFADTAIRLAQFCFEPRTAIALDWQTQWEAARAILELGHVKCGHNVWLFDNKVLRANDVRVTGTCHDTLQMFHHWQPDLPAHLQFAASFVQFPFPWKHLAATDIEFYGCCDVDATLRLYTMLERTLRRDGLWGDHDTGYLGQVFEVRPVLAAMEDRGMPIDDAERVRLGTEFEQAQDSLGAEIAALAPDACKRVHPKEGYKGTPPEVRKWRDEHRVEGVPDVEPVAILERFKDSGDDPELYHYERRTFAVPAVDPDSGSPVTIPTLRWCRVYDFNPNSSQQLIAYMRAKGHPIPKDKHREDDAGNNPDTTAAKELMRLANKTGDTFYLKVIEYRGLTKMRGTYVDGFAPGPDGCVHTSFTFATAIGQLSSRNPNIQNFPKLKPTPALAKALRRMVAAKPGKIITNWDYKSFHVLTLGFLAEDATWMRLARLDMHSFFTGHVLGLWDGPTILRESDEELMARFKWLKSNPEWKLIRDDQAKHAILGIGNGLHAKGLYERYMESFPPQPCKRCGATGKVPGVRGLKQCPECKGQAFIPGLRVAQHLLDVLEGLAPKIFAYQRGERKAAHLAGDKGFYSRAYGFARRFYEVYSFNKRWSGEGEPPPGDQSEEAVSFRHTNIAHCEVRARMKILDELGLAERYGMFNQVHDALMFHFDEALLDRHVEEVYPILAAPSKILRHPMIAPEGLSIGVEGEYGRTWAEMSPIEVPSATHMQIHTTATAGCGIVPPAEEAIR